ncbi:hypothetical protein D3C72_1484880 [compost metagenome]
MVAAGVGIIRLHGQRVFSGDYQPIAASGSELPDKTLGAAFGVAVGGIDEIAAALDVNVKQTAGLRLFRPPAPVGAEGHGAECQRRDAQAGTAQ